MLPVSPRWLAASAPAKARIASARMLSRTAPARRRVGSDGARRPVRKPISQADEREHDEHRGQQRTELVPGGHARAEGDVVGAERVPGEVPRHHPAGGDGAASSTAAPRRRSGTMQNHSARPDRQRDQRATGVGQHQRQQHQPHRRIGERAQQRVPRPARAQPHAADRAHRGGQADRVPVAVRRSQAGVDVAGVELVREHLGEQRVAADDDGRQDHAAEHRRPAAGERARRAPPRRRRRRCRRACARRPASCRPAAPTTRPTAPSGR